MYRLLLFLEMCFVHRAEGAYPVGGQVFELGAGGDAIVGVTGCGVIHIPAHIANVLFHDSEGLLGLILVFLTPTNGFYCVAPSLFMNAIFETVCLCVDKNVDKVFLFLVG